MLARIADVANEFRLATQDCVLPLASGIGVGLTVWMGTWIPILVAVFINLAYITPWFFRRTPVIPLSSIKTEEPEPKPDELHKWLASNNPAVQALAKTGVFKTPGPARLTDEMGTLERTLYRVSDEALDRTDMDIAHDEERFNRAGYGMIPYHTYGDRHTIETLREAATKWFEQQQLPTVPDGLVDIDDIDEVVEQILGAYRLATEQIVACLADTNVSASRKAELPPKLADLAQRCKEQLEDWQAELTRYADVAVDEALRIANYYIDKSLELDKELELQEEPVVGLSTLTLTKD